MKKTAFLLCILVGMLSACGGGGGGGEEGTTPTAVEVAPDSLAIPQNVSVSKSPSSLYVFWDAVTDAKYYEVYKSDAEDGEYTQVGEAQVSPYIDNNVIPGKTYWYNVRAGWRSKNGSLGDVKGDCSEKKSCTTNMNAPSSFSTSEDNADKVVLSWIAVQNVKHYVVKRGPSSTTLSELATVSSGTTYEDTTATPGTNYYYSVNAVSSEDVASSFTTAKSGYRPGAAPGSLTATNGSFFGKIDLSWTAVAGEVRYYIYMSENGGPYTQLASRVSSNYSHSNLTNANTVREYKVRAYNTNTCLFTQYSNIASGTLRTAAQTCSVNWTANREHAVNSAGGGYKVYYSTSSSFPVSSTTCIDVPWVSGSFAPTSVNVNFTSAGTRYFKIEAYSNLDGQITSSPCASQSVVIY